VVESFETRRGSHLYVEREGDGPLMLAIHGLGGGAYFFGGCARRMSRTGRFAAVDLPGTGASSSAVPASAVDWAGELADLIEHLGGTPAVLVGHSLGTILALEIWRQRPDLVRAMVFVGGLPAPRSVVCERLTVRAAAIRDHGIGGWGSRVVPGVFGARAIQTMPEVTALFARAFDAQDQSAYLATLELLVAADASAVVATATVPCVSISGDEDQYAPPDAIRAFVAQLPAGTPNIVLPGVGHLPFFEAPDAFAAALGAFVERLKVPGA
jgi:3-oxoadipate enol-lactonase